MKAAYSLLDDLGIMAAMGWFLREYKKTHGDIVIEEEILIREDEIPEPIKIVIFRALQAALDNIACHSKADVARIRLKKESGIVELVIEDNGTGLST